MSTSRQAKPARTPRQKPSPRTITAIVLGALIVLFAAVNSQTVTMHWIVTTSQTPLIVIIVGSGLVGFAAGWLLARRRASRGNAQ